MYREKSRGKGEVKDISRNRIRAIEEEVFAGQIKKIDKRWKGRRGGRFGVSSNDSSRFASASRLISASSLVELAVGSYWPEKKRGPGKEERVVSVKVDGHFDSSDSVSSFE